MNVAPIYCMHKTTIKCSWSLLGTWELRIDVQDYNNTKQYMKYSSIKVLGESDKYKLLLGDFKGGNVGKWLDKIANTVFTAVK